METADYQEDIVYEQYAQVTAAQLPWQFWRTALAYATVAAIVFLSVAAFINFKARDMVVYQPNASQAQSR